MPMHDPQIAIDAIRKIYDVLQVNADHAHWIGDTSANGILRDGYGFDWWPGDFKVRIRVFGPHPGREQVAYRLSVLTDFLCDVDATTPKFKQNLSLLNRFAPTFALCAHPTATSQLAEKYGTSFDSKSSKVWLASTAYLHEGIKAWKPRVFAGLAMLQPIEAQFRTESAKGLLGGQADRSNPPGCDSKKGSDNFLSVVQSEYIPFGKQKSRWIGTGEFENIIDKWGSCDSGFGFANDGLSLETPFGDHTALLLLKTDQPHPLLGSGLLSILKLPFLSDLERANESSLELNYAEAQMWTRNSPLIGSWSSNEARAEGEEKPAFGPAFGSFIPNLVYQPGLAENMVLYALGRAQWARSVPRQQLRDRLRDFAKGGFLAHRSP